MNILKYIKNERGDSFLLTFSALLTILLGLVLIVSISFAFLFDDGASYEFVEEETIEIFSIESDSGNSEVFTLGSEDAEGEINYLYTRKSEDGELLQDKTPANESIIVHLKNEGEIPHLKVKRKKHPFFLFDLLAPPEYEYHFYIPEDSVIEDKYEIGMK